jgi:hypothetical protein
MVYNTNHTNHAPEPDMKEQYIITDLAGDNLGTQMANCTQRAVHLFATRHNLIASRIKAVRFMDWQPRIAVTAPGLDSGL